MATKFSGSGYFMEWGERVMMLGTNNKNKKILAVLPRREFIRVQMNT